MYVFNLNLFSFVKFGFFKFGLFCNVLESYSFIEVNCYVKIVRNENNLVLILEFSKIKGN